MNDFDFENMQKKRIAQGARHRVCGSKSRKCSLPSDLLTPAQKRKLNGPVESYDMGRPMSWDRFTVMPRDLQVSYLDGLHKNYGVGEHRLTELFGVSIGTIRRYLSAKDLRGRMGFHAVPTNAQKSAWERFLTGENAVEPANDGPVETRPANADPLPALICALGGEISLEGDAADILAVLEQLSALGPATLRVTISFCAKEENREYDHHSNGNVPLSGADEHADTGIGGLPERARESVESGFSEVSGAAG